MNNRLQEFLAAENISQSQLAETLGVTPASVTHIISGRNKPGFDFLQALALKFPILNIRWLITGKGKMYDIQHSVPVSTEPERVVIFFPDGKYKEYR